MALSLVTLDFCSPCSETDEHVQFNMPSKTHGNKNVWSDCTQTNRSKVFMSEKYKFLQGFHRRKVMLGTEPKLSIDIYLLYCLTTPHLTITQ